MYLSQDSLRTLAEETGGYAAVNSNNLSNSLNRIVKLNSTYYVLGYYPKDARRDGRFHKIEVRVKATRPSRVGAKRICLAEDRSSAPRIRRDVSASSNVAADAPARRRRQMSCAKF